MPVTINADTVTGAAVVTADASGVLALQAAGNTGLTLNSSRAVGVGASPSFGSSGQVLTSAGSGAAPTWATPAVTAPAGTTGQVQINNAGAFGAVGSGTAGQVLTSAGAGAAPTFASLPGGGSWIKLSSSAAFSSSTLDFTGFVTSDYNTYAVVLYALSVQSGSYAAFRFFVGGSIQTSGYTSSGFYTDASITILARGGSAGTDAQMIRITNATNTDQAGVIFINANNYNSLTGTSIPSMNSQVGGGPFNVNFFVNGSLNTTSPITGIRFFSQGGTFAGYFDLYGIKR